MRFPTKSRLFTQQNPDTWITLEKIQHALGWTDKELIERLNLSEKKYWSLRSQGMEPPLYSMAQLIETIGLSIETIVSGKIDYQALQAHASGNLFYLPERYTPAAFSKRRTSIHLLAYIENKLGWRTKKYVMDHFQVTEAIFSDPESQVNFLFPSDLCQHLANDGCHPLIFAEMGAYSVVINKKSSLGNLMATLGSPKDLHEKVFTNIVGKSFDQNCDYQLLKLDEEGCLLEAKFTQEMTDLLKMKRPGNMYACASRGGSFASLTGYLDLPFSSITEPTCIHRGDPSCTYRISYRDAQTIYSKTHRYHYH